MTLSADDMSHHLPALRAVSRDRTGLPDCSDSRLQAAEADGLITFKGWPSGHWSLTPAGRGILSDSAQS